jgi:cytochrome oxidase Cu insertion factor (SCO1/SenC/PrrC family)
VVYLHLSVDPDNDTPERRKKYFNLYGIDAAKDDRWMFLSGKKSEMSKIWGFYGVNAKKVEDKRLPEKYYMEYEPKVVAIDGSGIIRYESGSDFSEEDIKSLIEKLSPKPSIKFSEIRFNCGTVKEGDIISHNFEFVNGGNSILRIKDIVPA